MDYIVQPGDTLPRIAFDHEVSLVTLLKYNPQISNPNCIRAYDRLYIP